MTRFYEFGGSPYGIDDLYSYKSDSSKFWNVNPIEVLELENNDIYRQDGHDYIDINVEPEYGSGSGYAELNLNEYGFEDCTNEYKNLQITDRKGEFRLVVKDDMKYLTIPAIELGMEMSLDIPLILYFPIHKNYINTINEACNYAGIK